VTRHSKPHASAGHALMRNEAAVLYLLKRKPALRRVLKQLNLKLDGAGRLMGIPFDGCPFRVDGCPLPIPMDEDVIVRSQRPPATKRAKTA